MITSATETVHTEMLNVWRICLPGFGSQLQVNKICWKQAAKNTKQTRLRAEENEDKSYFLQHFAPGGIHSTHDNNIVLVSCLWEVLLNISFKCIYFVCVHVCRHTGKAYTWRSHDNLLAP